MRSTLAADPRNDCAGARGATTDTVPRPTRIAERRRIVGDPGGFAYASLHRRNAGRARPRSHSTFHNETLEPCDAYHISAPTFLIVRDAKNPLLETKKKNPRDRCFRRAGSPVRRPKISRRSSNCIPFPEHAPRPAPPRARCGLRVVNPQPIQPSRSLWGVRP